MPWLGNGSFQRTDGVRTGATLFEQQEAAAVKVEAALMDAHANDLVDGLENTLTLDGQTTPTADIPFGEFRITGLGTGGDADHAAAVRQVRGREMWYSAIGGTANAITGSGHGVLEDGDRVVFIATDTNTGATTFKPGSGSALAVVTKDGDALRGGEIVDGDLIEAIYDGTSLRLAALSLGILYTEVPTTSGTAHNFANIPLSARRITLMFNQVSVDSTNEIQFQLGTSGGLVTSGYLGSCSSIIDATAASEILSTAFKVTTISVAAQQYSGAIVLNRVNETDVWVAYGGVGADSAAATFTLRGRLDMSAALTQLSVISVATFDAGSVNILVE
jgi:hypothetical protein